MDPKAPDAPFFVLNADVICEYPLKALVAFHKQRGAEGTIFVTKVKRSPKQTCSCSFCHQPAFVSS